jgi:UPF0755 protein
MLLLIAGAGGAYYIQNYLSLTVKTPKLIHIPKGSTKSIIKFLQDSGIEMKFFDYYLLKSYGYPQAGWIDLGSESLSRDQFYYKITHKKAALNQITLIPGETKEIFFEQIATKLNLDSTKLLKSYDDIAPYPDGVIMGETYSIPMGIAERELVEYLVSDSLKTHKSFSQKLLGRYDEKEWFTKYVTIASIITKEAADESEMPLVSAVIKNRLKIGMALQMDGTLNYKYRSHTKVTAKMLRDDTSVFNTYKNIGLIPHPICAVTISAIEASIKPANVNYLYFMRNKDGKHNFTNSYKKHLNNINRVKSVKK